MKGLNLKLSDEIHGHLERIVEESGPGVTKVLIIQRVLEQTLPAIDSAKTTVIIKKRPSDNDHGAKGSD